MPTTERYQANSISTRIIDRQKFEILLDGEVVAFSRTLFPREVRHDLIRNCRDYNRYSHLDGIGVRVINDYCPQEGKYRFQLFQGCQDRAALGETTRGIVESVCRFTNKAKCLAEGKHFIRALVIALAKLDDLVDDRTV